MVDHHEMSPDGRPDCEAVVNPKCAQQSSGSPFDYLCAAGVVFKLAHALLKTRPVESFDLKDYLDLVAMATISDIVPLVEENRLLVRHGLKRMSDSRNAGIKALMEVAQVKGPLTSADVGFRIGPQDQCCWKNGQARGCSCYVDHSRCCRGTKVSRYLRRA